LAALTLLSLAASAARADFDAEFADLQRKQACLDLARDADARFGVIYDNWFAGTASTDVLDNFATLRAEHDRYMLQFKTFVAKPVTVASDMHDLLTEVTAIDDMPADIRAVASSVAAKDELFLRSLGAIEGGLFEVESELTGAKVICPFGMHQALEEAVAQANAFRKGLSRVRYYLGQVAVHRGALVGGALKAKRAALNMAFAQQNRVELGALLEQVDTLLGADRLLARIEAWWHEAGTVQGVGRGEITKYVQFDRALSVVRGDLQTAQGFARELGSLTTLADDQRRIIAGELALSTKQLKDAEASLVQGGWRAVLERETMLTAARQKIATRYVAECLPLLEAFLSAAKSVDSLERFLPLERLYRREVDTCVAKS
jgi:hypothetical protein